MTKYIFITGGVVSGLGKGITGAALGKLLRARGYKVSVLKFDPYFNVDTSNLSPYQHGEIFVTDDGYEGDHVLGHYERMLNSNLCSRNNVTSGQIYSQVIENERRGVYNGKTVQVVPHITDEIKKHIYAVGREEKSDIVITEIGGTVGDIESHPFLEAIRQVQSDVGKINTAYIHVTLLPFIGVSGEQKTKPTQHSVKELQNLGIQPDVIVCRSDLPIGLSSKQKLSLFCNVDKDSIISSLTTNKLETIPLLLEEEKFADAVLKKLRSDNPEPDLSEWKKICDKIAEIRKSGNAIKLAIVGKYVDKSNAYISLKEAILHSSLSLGKKVEISMISSENVGKNAELLDEFDCIILASGFGERGFEGKVETVRYARTKNIPILMIGLGAQAGIIEIARDLAGLKDANSTEFSDCDNPVVTNMKTGAPSFTAGAFKCKLAKGTKVAEIYKSEVIKERHRHKYDFNPEYEKILSDVGLIFSGHGEDGIAQIFELNTCKFFIGVIFRPEFISRYEAPHPLFTALLSSAIKN